MTQSQDKFDVTKSPISSIYYTTHGNEKSEYDNGKLTRTDFIVNIADTGIADADGKRVSPESYDGYCRVKNLATLDEMVTDFAPARNMTEERLRYEMCNIYFSRISMRAVRQR